MVKQYFIDIRKQAQLKKEKEMKEIIIPGKMKQIGTLIKKMIAAKKLDIEVKNEQIQTTDMNVTTRQIG